MRFLAGIRKPIKHTQLLVQQVFALGLHSEFGRSQRAVGKLLRLVEQSVRRHGVQNANGTARFVGVGADLGASRFDKLVRLLNRRPPARDDRHARRNRA